MAAPSILIGKLRLVMINKHTYQKTGINKLLLNCLSRVAIKLRHIKPVMHN